MKQGGWASELCYKQVYGFASERERKAVFSFVISSASQVSVPEGSPLKFQPGSPMPEVFLPGKTYRSTSVTLPVSEVLAPINQGSPAEFLFNQSNLSVSPARGNKASHFTDSDEEILWPKEKKKQPKPVRGPSPPLRATAPSEPATLSSH